MRSQYLKQVSIRLFKISSPAYAVADFYPEIVIKLIGTTLPVTMLIKDTGTQATFNNVYAMAEKASCFIGGIYNHGDGLERMSIFYTFLFC